VPKKSYIYIFAFLTFIAATIFSTYGYARIDILPRKVVMESRDRSAEITVMNLFEQPSLMRVSIIHYRQNEDGSYTKLDEPLSDVFDPETIARFSPRQFILSPGGRQKIRLSLRKPADLPQGEYRFHVLVTRYDVEDDGSTKSNEGASIQLKMNMGVAIPDVSAKMENIRIIPASESSSGKPQLGLTIFRDGSAGSIGELQAFWTPKGAKSRKIGEITNMNVFSEIKRRDVVLPLEELPLGAGQLRLIYTNDDGAVYDEVILDQ
jgi:hypothetical protein